jgi:hypothetical protein
LIKILHNPIQVAFMEARRARTPDGRRLYDRLLLCAGRRGGKTMISALAAVEEASVPNTVGAMFAPTYPMLHDTVIPAFRQFWPETWCYGGSWDKAWSESHLELNTAVNSKVLFRSLDNPDRSRGLGLDWCSIDEASLLPKVAWDTAQPTLAERHGIAWICTSPRGFDWVYKEFWQKAQEGEPGYWAGRYKTIDNPVIDRKLIERQRRSMDPTFFRQEYEADFVNFTGAIYGSLVDERILRTDNDVRRAFPEWPRIDQRRAAVIGLDPGADHPFAASLLVASDIGWITAGEYRQRNKVLVEHVAQLHALSTKFGDRETRWLVDRTAKQVQLELAQYAVYASGSESHVESGIMRTQSWLRDGKLWLLEREVPKTIEEMRAYRWADAIEPGKALGKPKPFKLDDDLCDANRYAVMSCSEPEGIEDAIGGRSIESVPEEARWAWLREQQHKKDHEEDSWLPESAEDYPIGDMYA